MRGSPARNKEETSQPAGEQLGEWIPLCQRGAEIVGSEEETSTAMRRTNEGRERWRSNLAA